MNKIRLIVLCFLAGGSVALRAMDSDNERNHNEKMIITRMPTDLIKPSRAEHVDFSGCDFSNQDFSNVTFIDLVLNGTNLSGANFQNACLQNVRGDQTNLSGADLSEAILKEVDLTNVIFDGAKMEKMCSESSRIQGHCHEVQGESAQFLNSHLHCDFKKSKFNKAKFIQVNFNASLANVHLHDAYFEACFFIAIYAKHCCLKSATIEASFSWFKESEWQEAKFKKTLEIVNGKKFICTGNRRERIK